MGDFYSIEELREKIIEIDAKLEEGFVQGRLDSRMTESEWRASLVVVREQRDRYWAMYEKQTGSGNRGKTISLLPADD